MSELILATHNPGKVAELRVMLAGLPISVSGLAEWPPYVVPEEDQPTFEGNARLKAVAAVAALGRPVLADDSGLVVDALDGAPGVLSARYGGPGLSDPQRVDYLLAKLAERGVSSSPARFVCALALALPSGEVHPHQAAWEGIVCGPPRGDNGFGYDPIFVPSDSSVTSAQLSSEEKNRVSHRGLALGEVVTLLRRHPELLRSAGNQPSRAN